jgi:predicted RNA-binding Zn-ribbon protein involved in translation (DUF1610 family)
MRRSKKTPVEGPVQKFLRRWLVDIIAVAAAVFGFFLLFEQTDLSETFWDRLGHVWEWIGRGILSIIAAVRTVHASDVLGLILLLLAAVLLVRRAGQRIRQSSTWSARACPECGHSLHRTKRSSADVLTWLLPLRRYRCRNCGWTGLRAKSPGYEQESETLASH